MYKKNDYCIDNVFQGIVFDGREALNKIPRLIQIDEQTTLDCYMALLKECLGFINNGTVSRCSPPVCDETVAYIDFVASETDWS